MKPNFLELLHRSRTVARAAAAAVLVIVTNQHLHHQIATIESLGLTRRFDDDRDQDMYTSHAYA